MTPATPYVPAGADLTDECTRAGMNGCVCLRELRNGFILPADLCAACRRVHRELLDSVLEPDQ